MITLTFTARVIGARASVRHHECLELEFEVADWTGARWRSVRIYPENAPPPSLDENWMVSRWLNFRHEFTKLS